MLKSRICQHILPSPYTSHARIDKAEAWAKHGIECVHHSHRVILGWRKVAMQLARCDAL